MTKPKMPDGLLKTVHYWAQILALPMLGILGFLSKDIYLEVKSINSHMDRMEQWAHDAGSHIGFPYDK